VYVASTVQINHFFRLMKPRQDNLTFRINSDSKAKLKKLATAKQRTVSQVVSLIIDRYLEDFEAGKAPKLQGED
jgi:hypothetical protein